MKTSSHRFRRCFIFTLSLCVLLLSLWCGVFWRWVPRVEIFEAVPGSESDQVFHPVRVVPPDERSRSIPRAEKLLSEPVLSVTDKPHRAPTNDPHDYVSLSIYWWPNPVTRLPYLHHDGHRNPEAKNYDAPKLQRMVSDVEVLANAFAATGDERFSNRATQQLRVWFIRSETRMNPHFTFAQMMPGWAAGGRQGIIEGLSLATQLPDALALLDAHRAITNDERRSQRDWLGRYLAWLRQSSAGKREHTRPNNHGTWHDVNRDGVWSESGIVERIPEQGLAVRWSAKVSNGYSAPSVAAGRVFITDYVSEAKLERVLCFDEATGRQLWMHSYTVEYKDMEYGNGPRAAPTVVDGKVYTLGTLGHLFCLDATNGSMVWKKELVKDFNAKLPNYGMSAAPLVVGETLIVMAGGKPDACVVALGCKTGETRWTALPDRVAYSAPIVTQAGGCEQLIVWSADAITSLDAQSGKIYWKVEWRANFDPAQMVATLVRHDDMLLGLGAWSRGSKMLELDATKPAATVLWETRRDPSTMHSTPLFQEDGHFYAILNDGSLACMNSATGDKVWSTQEPTSNRMGNAHLVSNGERVFIFNHTGHLILAHLTPKGYEERGRCLLVEPTAGYRAQGPLTWAHPAFANKCVFARNDRELVCVSLATEDNVAIAGEQALFKSSTPAGLPSGSAAVAFSPDGKSLAVGGSWGEGVKIIDLASNKPLPGPSPLKDFLSAVAYSPDGKWLIIAGGSEFTPARNGGKTAAQIKTFDLAANKEIGEITGHTNKVFTVAVSPDSQKLATGSADNSVRLWDIATMKERGVLTAHTAAVMSVAFSPDGKTLATASVDHTMKLWDVATGNMIESIVAHQDEVLAIAFSPDGKLIATGSIDSSVRLWDATTRKEIAILRGHRGSVNCLVFSPDGKTLASGSGDETIRLWLIADEKEIATLKGHRSAVTSIAFAPNARTLASAGRDDAVRVWELPVVK